MNQNKEIRSYTKDFRFDAESRTVEGYAVVFNSESVDLGGFTETIAPSAITDALIERSDVHALIDHDMQRPLARSKYGKGSLTLTIDETGLFFRFVAPNNRYGDEVLELLQRGDCDACSFAFTFDNSDPDARTYDRNNGNLHRTITRIDELFDVSVVHYPAYPATSCVARAEDTIKECERVDAELNALEDEINKL